MKTPGQRAYETWRDGTGIPEEFAWEALPKITQRVWDRTAQAVLALEKD